MRNLAAGLVLLCCVAAPAFAWADNPTAAQRSPRWISQHSGDQLRIFLNSLDLDPVAKAYAAECKDEGELCKTNTDCCPGLECSGDPQTTCRQQE